MKTIKQWFNTLPPPLKKEAIEQATLADTLSIRCNSLSSSIAQGFLWSSAPSGFEFWGSFHSAFSNAEQLQVKIK